jgi:kynurenine formamidase
VILPQFTHDEMETWGNGTPEDPLGGCTAFLAMMDHVGTHVDSFCHTKRGGATIDQMPLDMFMGKAVCLDMRHVLISATSTQRILRKPKKAGVRSTAT